MKIRDFIKYSLIASFLTFTSPNTISPKQAPKQNSLENAQFKNCIYRPKGEISKKLDLDGDGKLETLLNAQEEGYFSIKDHDGYVYTILQFISDYCVRKEGSTTLIDIKIPNNENTNYEIGTIIFTGKNIYSLRGIPKEFISIQSPKEYKKNSSMEE